jgi:hypothetical protein
VKEIAQAANAEAGHGPKAVAAGRQVVTDRFLAVMNRASAASRPRRCQKSA